ncbi:hypothetical protein MIND_00596600 [Mycena indigotica]|uniref:F-box domain-containing protein n=1 Tax=Mycena indigotica TaxID=2126181 RepID=A0A8H6SSP5_9AGAR|nr:uncharacterized protein MIND_00596600 [Mycena indigotica]KAF7303672.1 hypothetical protein MIND_00596600 [Mycena indigotica]
MNYAETIPVELWLHCGSFCWIPELRQLCLTCTTFRDIFQPVVFAEKKVVIPKRERYDDERAIGGLQLDHFSQFSDTFDGLITHSHLASYVKVLHVVDNLAAEISHGESLTRKAIPDRILRKMGAFSKLRSLNLSNLQLYGDGRRALDELPSSLEHLGLEMCGLASGSLLALKSFRLTRCLHHAAEDNGLLHIVDPKTVQTLVFDASANPGGWEDAINSVVRSLCETTDAVFPSLRLLNVSFAATPKLLVSAFLRKCEHVETLILDSSAHLFEMRYLPNLHSIHCPTILAEALVSNRRVTTLTLVDRGLRTLPLSKALACISSCPTLETINISSFIGQDDLLSVLDATTTAFPRLRNLRLALQYPYGLFKLLMLLLASTRSKQIPLPPGLHALCLVLPTSRADLTRTETTLEPMQLARLLVRDTPAKELIKLSIMYVGCEVVCLRAVEGSRWIMEQWEAELN